MKFRSKNLMIGTIALAIIGASLGGVIGYQRFSRVKQLVPFHVVFEGSASGLRRGSSVNFAGVRVGEVRSLKLDHPRRVVALALIDPGTPLRADTQVGLEFQGLTGIAAISFTGGTIDGPPPSVDAEGVPTLTADKDGTYLVKVKVGKGQPTTVVRLIEDGTVIGRVYRTTGSDRMVEFPFVGAAPGAHRYTVELENSAGVTPGGEITVRVAG